MRERLPIAETLTGRHLLVTGVSGFLGKVWLCHLLDQIPEVGRITVLIRARRHESARARFVRMAERSPAFRPLRARHGANLLPWLDGRVQVITGDCASPWLGQDPESARELARTVDLVLHFAGLTDFAPDPRDALAANVLGALHAADLAACTPSRRLLHVSTAFVAGMGVHGDVPEALEPGRTPRGASFEPRKELRALEHMCRTFEGRRSRLDAVTAHAKELGWPNLYTYSKGLAEHLLSTRDDLDLTLVRPAIVECARSYPFPGWNEGINTSGPLVWLFSTSFRHFPSRPQNRFDVVPVDTVARVTTAVAAAALRSEAGGVFHVSSSDVNPLTFGRAIELTNLGVRRMHAREDASRRDRFVTRHLDVVPIPAEKTPLSAPANLGKLTRQVRSFLSKVDLARDLPPSLHARWGETLDARIGRWVRACRKTERNLRIVEEMLDLYRPFIHDNDYVFRADRTRALTDRLAGDEAEAFAFDVADIDWRHYWLEVEVPGLEKWTLPLMRGEKAPEDEPPAPTRPDPPAAEHPPFEATVQP